MKSGMSVPQRVGPSFVALLLSAGVLLPVFPGTPEVYAAETVQAEALPSNSSALRVSVTDAVNGRALEGVKITLYWADTAANRAAGRLPGKALPDANGVGSPSAPTSDSSGLYIRSVPGEADYYLVGEKNGYLPFDSRKASGSDAAAGILHIGATGTDYAFSLTPAAHKYPAYMSGYTDGLFRPEQNVTRVELAAVLQRSMGKDYKGTEAAFRDIDPGKWSAASVAIVTANGWMQGTGGSRFEPNREVSRAELAQILVNVFGWKNEAGSKAASFNDTAGHWAADAIAAAAANGALGGYPNGSFRPDQAVTRAEIAVLFNRLTDRPADPGLPMTWSDVAPSHWAYGDIMAASLDHTPSSTR
ncbi:hypothetical protein CDO73_10035 [Saccharibacillus sp. O23]|uniref:S-layer homology domain-containing protein n=1 Tax=Saccharibacillus sp. O23 TaxID=2009338 RepID=UPI000B4E67DE|nr:S-layer homology domain-containing protein [Saccharibacillus sp. O23]OWR30916.1 hypothetical protein CDO73_10035 [Saccharibacillus sp. O23]